MGGKALPKRGLRPITEVISFMAENSRGCGAGLGGRGTPTAPLEEELTLRMLWLSPAGMLNPLPYEEGDVDP